MDRDIAKTLGLSQQFGQGCVDHADPSLCCPVLQRRRPCSMVPPDRALKQAGVREIDTPLNRALQVQADDVLRVEVGRKEE